MDLEFLTNEQDYWAQTGLKELMHIDEIIEERCFGSSNKTVYVCWTSRPIWAWEGQLGLAVTMQDAGVSGAG